MKSKWYNPVVLVLKKNSSIRFCIDFRYLNSVSQFGSYLTPIIDDLLELLGKAKYLTTIYVRGLLAGSTHGVVQGADSL